MDDTSAPVSLFHSYDEEHSFLEKVLRDEAAAKPGLRVLEAGCGQPKSGSYPVAASAGGGLGGPMMGAIRSLM